MNSEKITNGDGDRIEAIDQLLEQILPLRQKKLLLQATKGIDRNSSVEKEQAIEVEIKNLKDRLRPLEVLLRQLMIPYYFEYEVEVEEVGSDGTTVMIGYASPYLKTDLDIDTTKNDLSIYKNEPKYKLLYNEFRENIENIFSLDEPIKLRVIKKLSLS